MTDLTPPENLPEEPQPEAQLGLFGEASNAPIKPARSARRTPLQKAGLDKERLDSYKALMASLAEKRADNEGLSQAVGAIYKAGFGQNTKAFYAYFGLRPGKREVLPVGILRILIVYELAAKRRIDRHIIKGQTQDDINQELANQCRIATQFMRRALYWSERAGQLESTSLLAEPPSNYPIDFV